MQKTKTDFNTIKAFEDPNDEHIKALYKKLGPIVIGYVINNSGSEEEGEDVFKEAYIHMYNKVANKKYQEMGKADEYFVRIATNIWKMQLRQKKRNQNTQNLSDIEYGLEDQEGTIEGTIVQNEKLAILRSAMSKISQNCQEVFRMHYFLEMTFVEIAEHLGLKDATVRKRHFDCKSKLKALLINVNG